jgi:hypothetical protein
MEKVFLEPPFATIQRKKCENGGELPRITFNYNRFIEKGKGCLEPPLINTFVGMGE